MKRLLLALLLLVAHPAWPFDQQHVAWDALLHKHVTWQPGGHESKVSYAGFQQERAALQSYLGALSAITDGEFRSWSKNQRLAFLINAYNVFTVELILSRYPDIASIRDFGLIINNPWKKKFFTLFGKDATLDGIEHGMIRAQGVYDDPRVHMALNCASIGCPALRPEAYVADRLDMQLDEQVTRFLSDKTRNRYNPQKKALEVSKIFDWYGRDFSTGYRGISSLEGFFANYAAQLADTPEGQQQVRDKQARIRFLDYDWGLNDRR
jgi:hypothetical protein